MPGIFIICRSTFTLIFFIIMSFFLVSCSGTKVSYTEGKLQNKLTPKRIEKNLVICVMGKKEIGFKSAVSNQQMPKFGIIGAIEYSVRLDKDKEKLKSISQSTEKVNILSLFSAKLKENAINSQFFTNVREVDNTKGYKTNSMQSVLCVRVDDWGLYRDMSFKDKEKLNIEVEVYATLLNGNDSQQCEISLKKEEDNTDTLDPFIENNKSSKHATKNIIWDYKERYTYYEKFTLEDISKEANILSVNFDKAINKFSKKLISHLIL